jgi:hypothetical protein
VAEGFKDPTGKFHPTGPKKNSGAVAGAAVAIVLSAVAGGGVGGAASVSGAADESSAGARTSQSQEADEPSVRARNSRGQAEVRIRGSDDSLKARLRLRRMGGHPTTLDAQSDKNCADYSDSDVHSFFLAHQCTSLYRTLIEYREGNYIIRFSIATIEMPDYNTAVDLYALLSREGGGDITPLSPKGGKYRHVPFTSAPSTTTRHDTTVINIRTQAVGRTPGAEVLASLATNVLFNLD